MRPVSIQRVSRLAGLVLVLAGAQSAFGGPPGGLRRRHREVRARPLESPLANATADSSPDPAPPWATQGRWSFGFQVAYGVESGIPRDVSHVNLLYAQPQLGFVVRDFALSRFSLSRFEVLTEGILGAATHPGGRILGQSLIFRLDGRPHGRLIPLVDFGAGVSNTTIPDHAPELTGHTQFNPQAGFGFQYFFSPQRAFVVEYRYVHFSNAGIEEPNPGFNANMISIGFRWLRRPRRHLGTVR